MAYGSRLLADGLGHNKMMCLPKAVEAGHQGLNGPVMSRGGLLAVRIQLPPTAKVGKAPRASPQKSAACRPFLINCDF